MQGHFLRCTFAFPYGWAVDVYGTLTQRAISLGSLCLAACLARQLMCKRCAHLVNDLKCPCIMHLSQNTVRYKLNLKQQDKLACTVDHENMLTKCRSVLHEKTQETYTL